MDQHEKIFVAGHTGMVGSAIVRKLTEKGFTKLILRTSAELDLRNQRNVEQFFSETKPAYVFLAAAKVGGIISNNKYRAEFLYDNLMIQTNVIHSSYLYQVKKLMFLGSSCIYPKFAPQPLKEEYLLSGALEPTNEPYAIAKIAGLKMCEAYHDQYECNFISVMPTNLYGPNDNYHPENSHVLPALIKRFHEAVQNDYSSVTVWGSGNALREFLHTDDLADACIYLMEHYNSKEFVNIGFGKDISIRDLAGLVKKITGYKGEVIFDTAMPDGTPRKLMDTSRLTQLGWKPRINLEEGITRVYHEYRLTHGKQPTL